MWMNIQTLLCTYILNKSSEYLEALMEVSYCLNAISDYNQAQKVLSEAYDVALEVYGSKVGESFPEIISHLGLIKARFGEFEIAFRMLSEAKEIQEKLSSRNSINYRYILHIEANVVEMLKEHKEKTRKRRLKYGIIGGVTIFGILSVSAYYILKSREKSS